MVEIGIRNKRRVPSFKLIKSPEEIPTMDKIPYTGKRREALIKLHAMIWQRCMDRGTGWCAFPTRDMAKELGITDRTVYMHLNELKRLGFIHIETVRHSQKQKDGTIKFFSYRMFLCHAAMYHSQYFNPPLGESGMWKNDIRPDVSADIRSIKPSYKVRKDTVIKGKYGDFIVAARYKDSRGQPILKIGLQEECTKPGTNFVPPEAWDELETMQQIRKNEPGYPGRDRALRRIGYNLKTYRKRTRDRLALEASNEFVSSQ